MAQACERTFSKKPHFIRRLSLRAKVGRPRRVSPTFLSSFKILHLTFASFRVIRGSISFSAGGKRFLTTKGTKITKFSDIFIFVSFVLSVVDSIIF
jgi:hypothetical protein